MHGQAFESLPITSAGPACHAEELDSTRNSTARGHLSQLLDEAAARRPDHPAVEDEAGRTLTYRALAERRRPAGDPAGPLGRQPGRPGRPLAPQEPGGRHGDPRHSSLRRGLRARRSDGPGRARGRDLRRQRRQGRGGRRVSRPGAARGVGRPWTAASPDPRRYTGASLAGASDPETTPVAMIAPGDACWTEIMADDAPSPLPPARMPTTWPTSCSPRARPDSPRA